MDLVNNLLDKLIEKLNKNKIGRIFVDIIVKGNIPFFNFIKKYLVFASLFVLIIFIYPNLFKDFGEYSYNLLIFILFISPLSKIFPKFRILNKVLILRRAIGIIIGAFLIAHFIGFILAKNIDILGFLQKEILNYKGFLFWGIWGFIFMLFPFLTSNNLSQKILKTKWKFFQYGAYLFFIFGSIHLYKIEGEIEELGILFLWIILKILAYRKVVILK